MAKEWFYRESDGADCGPFSGLEMRELVKLGRVLRETPVSPDGKQVWVVAERVRGLFTDPEPVRGPATAQAAPIRGPQPVASPHTRLQDLATGAEWDDISAYLAAQSSQPTATGQSSPGLEASSASSSKPDPRPAFEELDPDRTRAASQFHQNRAILFQVLFDPRDAFDQVLAPGMLPYALGMIAATAILYALMCVPSLYRIESSRTHVVSMMQQFPRAASGIPGRGMMSGFPRDFPSIPSVAEAVPAESVPGPSRRVLGRLWSVGPNLFLAAIVSLGAIGFLGTFVTAALAADRRPQAIRRGVTTLGLSLTPLVCLLGLALPIGFLATEIAVLCAYLGVFVSVLFYHEALQAIGDIPFNWASCCIPLIFAAGVYLLVRCSAGAGISLMMRGFPF